MIKKVINSVEKLFILHKYLFFSIIQCFSFYHINQTLYSNDFKSNSTHNKYIYIYHFVLKDLAQSSQIDQSPLLISFVDNGLHLRESYFLVKAVFINKITNSVSRMNSEFLRHHLSLYFMFIMQKWYTINTQRGLKSYLETSYN